MNLELYESVYIIQHEVELLKARFDYRAFLIIQLAVEELERVLVETKQIEPID